MFFFYYYFPPKFDRIIYLQKIICSCKGVKNIEQQSEIVVSFYFAFRDNLVEKI